MRPLDASAPLRTSYDVALLDLDGVVYRGAQAIAGAADALAAARAAGMRLAFVTNNALRQPEEVAEKLAGVGVPAEPDDVVTSAQAAARMLAERLDPGARVLVCGGGGLRTAVRRAGLALVQSADDDPAAVVNGFDPTLDYERMAEAALAIRHGALWVASNLDLTVPAERGLLPGAGSIVALLRAATDRQPLVAGKPERALHEESVARSVARRPLVVGDRLDTDVEGGNRARTPTLLVLTGVATLADLLAAGGLHRPTFLGRDLAALGRSQPGARLEREAGGTSPAASCGDWRAQVQDGCLCWEQRGEPADGSTPDGSTPDGSVPGDSAPDSSDGLDPVRAALAAAWAAADAGHPVHAVTGDVPSGCDELGLPPS